MRIKIILYWGTGNIRKKPFLGGTKEQANLFQGNKGTSTSLGGPRKRCQILLKIQASLNEHARGYKTNSVLNSNELDFCLIILNIKLQTNEPEQQAMSFL